MATGAVPATATDVARDLAVPAGFAAGGMRLAFGMRPLFAWAVAAGLTSLLDEVLVAFAMVRLSDCSVLARGLAVGAWTVGMVGGLVVLERYIDRFDSRRVLLGGAITVAAALVALAFTSDPVFASIALFVLGVGTSPLHPLASARAYAALPGRPFLVNAVGAALAPLDAAAPLALAAIAFTWGAPAAIAALLVAPIGIMLAAWYARS